MVGGRCIIAPMSNTDLAGRMPLDWMEFPEAVDLTVLIPLMPPGTPLLLGVAKPIIKGLVTQYRVRLVEIAESDEIAVLNSIPTAEGAIQVAMEEIDITIHGSQRSAGIGPMRHHFDTTFGRFRGPSDGGRSLQRDLARAADQ